MIVCLASVLAVPAAGLAAAFALVRRRLAVVRVHGMSMAPTYVPGELVLVRRVPARRIRTGDVVVIGLDLGSDLVARPAGPLPAAPVPPGWVMKRVIALPGDPVPDVVASAVADRGPAGGRRVPPDHLVVLGDNREHSIDSRTWGCLPTRRLLGVVTRRLRVSSGPRRRSVRAARPSRG